MKRDGTDAPDELTGGIGRGVAVIRSAIVNLPISPGVYRMVGADENVLYVGKARNLRQRVRSYIQLQRMPNRLQRMVSLTEKVEILTTHTEVEALLLESNLIKRYKPRFNILLRDDKSFPQIVILGDHDFPRIAKHRGNQLGAKNRYFGPFASASAVNTALVTLQRAFLLRNCTDSYFANRTRPCLQYHIRRCSAPCVQRIDQDQYAVLVAEAEAFLVGRSQETQRKLAQHMEEASDRLDFETAAKLRDRIRALTFVQGHQNINTRAVNDADVFALAEQSGQTCVQVFFFRNGQHHGNHPFYPRHSKDYPGNEVMAAFLAQFYESRTAPAQVLVNIRPQESELLEAALTERAGRRIVILAPIRGDKAILVEYAARNAKGALARRIAETGTQRETLKVIADKFGLDKPLHRIEVYDNSHLQGAQPYGAMIVVGEGGFDKKSYRKYAIRQSHTSRTDPVEEVQDSQQPYYLAEPVRPGDDEARRGGDDYAMLREVLTRRFQRSLADDPERSGPNWPDLILIDGGRGQLSTARQALDELGLQDMAVIAISKGPDRNAGREQFHLPGKAPISLEERSRELFFLQNIRDEAHRFAIGAHRKGRSKAISTNRLDGIPGVGLKRKQALLRHFGSARSVAQAGTRDLMRVPGISAALAQQIHGWFQDGKG